MMALSRSALVLFTRGGRIVRLGLALLGVGLMTAVASAQSIERRSLRPPGFNANSINFVFLGDGYTEAEREQFFDAARQKLVALTSTDALGPFGNVCNGFAVFTASEESGTDMLDQDVERDTYYNTGFNGQVNSRSLVVRDLAGLQRVSDILRSQVPDYDVVVLMVNTTRAGGTGGFPAIISMDASSDEIARHEIGHSFAGLADEYVEETAIPYFPPREAPNATQHLDRTRIPWRDFITDDVTLPSVGPVYIDEFVGAFEGAYYRATGYYRPTYDSKMRSLHRPFGPVNVRAFVDAIHALDLNQAPAPPTITVGPISQALEVGDRLVLTARATGIGPLSYQWMRDGKFLADETQLTLSLNSASLQHAGVYRIEVSNARGRTLSEPALVTVGQARILAAPTHRTVAPGGSTTFNVSATSVSGPLTYQWFKDDVAIPGATQSWLTLHGLSSADAGDYTVSVFTWGNPVTTGIARLIVGEPVAGRLVNGSVRALAPGGSSTLIVGYVVAGPDRMLLTRAVGPALEDAGIVNFLPDPRLDFYRSDLQPAVRLASNDDWAESQATALADAFRAVGASPLGAAAKDAAVLAAASRNISVHVRDTAGRAGVTVVELFDYDSSTASRLVNLSARNFVGSGEQVLIAGFVFDGTLPKRFVIRGLGPELATVGVPGTISNPKLELHTNVWRDGAAVDRVVASNDDWGSGDRDAIRTAFRAVGASVFADDASQDAALVVELPPGLYSVILSGVGAGVGEGMIEVFELP